MRIAMTIHALRGGGAERIFVQLASRWAAAGHEVHVVTWSAMHDDPLGLDPRLHRHALDQLRPSRNLWQAWRAGRQRTKLLRDTLVAIAPQLVLSFCDRMNIDTLRAAHGLRMPVWIAERSDPAQQHLGRWWEYLRRRYYPGCTGCIVQTPAIRDTLSHIMPSRLLRVIPNPVNLPVANAIVEPSTDGAEVGCTAGLQPNDTKFVLAVGRLSPEKGFEQLVEAWRIAQPQLGNWRLQIAGAGPQMSHLQRLSSDLPQLDWLGWVDDPSHLYRQASLFVLPSHYEGFPNVLLEAMSHALACISTHCSQAVEQLADAGHALRLVSTRSAAELAAEIVSLATDGDLRQRMGRQARQVSRNYTWEQIGPQWDELLNQGS